VKDLVFANMHLGRLRSSLELPVGHTLMPGLAITLIDAMHTFLPHAVEQGLDNAKSAIGRCDDTSLAFREVLLQAGMSEKDCSVEDYAFLAPEWDNQDRHVVVTRSRIIADKKRYPFRLPRPVRCNWHWAVRVGNVIIDWTARQFDSEAGFPAVWIDNNPPQPDYQKSEEHPA
jgi:hypothetical protein